MRRQADQDEQAAPPQASAAEVLPLSDDAEDRPPAPSSDIIPVILCGGSGTRLWPLSRREHPKPLIPLGERSPFQETVLRVRGAGFARPVVIANEAYRFTIAEQLAQLGIGAEIVLEPEGRDSGPAVAVAAGFAAGADPHSILLVLPCDHQVCDRARFRADVEEARKAAASGRIVCFGVQPGEPSTAYGYISPGEALGIAGCSALSVERFTEKPDAETAAALVSEGALWNSGIFLFRAGDMLRELTFHAPQVLRHAEAALDTARSDLGFLRLGEEAFAGAPSISFDHAVMEHTRSAAVIPAGFGWSEVGNWNGVWQASPHDADGNAVAGNAVVAATENSLVHGQGPLTVVVGLRDAVVVSTRDAVLVADRAACGEIKDLVTSLQQAGCDEALRHSRVDRPWGYFDTIASGPGFRVKRLCVRPGHQLSLQKHAYRAEHWAVISGVAEVTLGCDVKRLEKDASLCVPPGVLHRLANAGEAPLEVIEIQTGAVLHEEDILRFEDDYGRTR